MNLRDAIGKEAAITGMYSWKINLMFIKREGGNNG
jgi:hypothetical protein